MKATTKEQQHYSAVNQGIVQDIGVLGAEGASDDTVHDYSIFKKAVVLCLLLSPRVSQSNIRSADQQKCHGFPEPSPFLRIKKGR